MRWKTFLSAFRIGLELIRRTGGRVFVRTVQICLVAAGYISLHPDQCPRLTLNHRHRHRILALRHQNWNHQYWSHVIFADESIVSLYICNGPTRGFPGVVERLINHCIQETDGIRGYDDQSGWGWPWTHYRISDETSAGGSSFRVYLPTCDGDSDEQVSVWAIGLDVMGDNQLLLNVLEPCGQRHDVQLAWSAPSWFLVLRENSFVSWYEEGHGVLLMWSPSIDTHVAPGYNCYSHELVLGSLDGTFWHANNFGHLLRRLKTREPDNLSIITSRILVGMMQKWWSTINVSQQVGRGLLNISGVLYWHWHSLHQLWGKAILLVGWFHIISGQCIYVFDIKINLPSPTHSLPPAIVWLLNYIQFRSGCNSIMHYYQTL